MGQYSASDLVSPIAIHTTVASISTHSTSTRVVCSLACPEELICARISYIKYDPSCNHVIRFPWPHDAAPPQSIACRHSQHTSDPHVKATCLCRIPRKKKKKRARKEKEKRTRLEASGGRLHRRRRAVHGRPGAAPACPPHRARRPGPLRCPGPLDIRRSPLRRPGLPSTQWPRGHTGRSSAQPTAPTHSPQPSPSHCSCTSDVRLEPHQETPSRRASPSRNRQQQRLRLHPSPLHVSCTSVVLHVPQPEYAGVYQDVYHGRSPQPSYFPRNSRY